MHVNTPLTCCQSGPPGDEPSLEPVGCQHLQILHATPIADGPLRPAFPKNSGLATPRLGGFCCTQLMGPWAVTSLLGNSGLPLLCSTHGHFTTLGL